MYRQKTIAVLCVLLVASASAVCAQPHGQGSAEASYRAITDFRLTGEFGWLDKFLGNDNRGTYGTYGTNLSLSSGPYTLFTFRTTGFDYRNVELTGLGTNKSENSFGGTAIMSRKVKLRLVYNSWVDSDNGAATQALGMYLEYRPSRTWRIEYGEELFYGQSPEIYFAMAERTMTNTAYCTGFAPDGTPVQKPIETNRYLYAGFSRHYAQEPGQEHRFRDKLMVSCLVPAGPWRIGAGFAHRIDSLEWSGETRAWTIAIGLPSSDDSTSWSPSLYAKATIKPGSKNIYAMGSFYGHDMPDAVLNMLFRAGFRSMLMPTRVVNNQSFDIRVQDIHTQEHGKIGWYAAYFEFEPTDYLVSKSFKGAVYYTWTRFRSQPFLGYAYSYQEEVTFDFMERKLESPGHEQHMLSCGGRLGNVRFEATGAFGTTGFEGGAITTTAWF
ncbi:MAG: hypothetical protein WC505_04950 [Patescibacteria group bacterium]